jgi:predicted alpha/beta superfamily hydrolase
VGLPANYHKDSSYTVVYVLDAEHRFELTYTLTKELFENQSTIPEVIVVGIPHIDRFHRINDLTFTDSKVDAKGKEDTIGYFNSSMTGNGLFFLKFLENEVLPFVNKAYSTNGFNTLMGHSIGGYFCAYILPIQKSFSAFQIYDASIWYNDGDAILHLQQKLDSNYKSNIFISKGISFDGPRENVDHHLLMIDSLGTFLNNYPKLTLTTAAYEKDHNGMYLFSVMDGLTTLFKDE